MTGFGVFVLWSLVGWLMVWLGAKSRRYLKRKLEEERARATGTAVELLEEPYFRRGRRFIRQVSVVSFSADGTEYRVRREIGDRERPLPIGARVELLYDPRDPNRFHLEQDAGLSFAGRRAIIFGVVWILVTAAATLILWTVSSGYGLEDIPGLLQNLVWDLERMFRSVSK